MTDVSHDPAHRRFVAPTPAGDAILSYEQAGDRTLDLQHTIVPESERGAGVGEALVKAAFAHARAEGLTLIPTCPFVEAWVRRHPDSRDVVAG